MSTNSPAGGPSGLPAISPQLTPSGTSKSKPLPVKEEGDPTVEEKITPSGPIECEGHSNSPASSPISGSHSNEEISPFGPSDLGELAQKTGELETCKKDHPTPPAVPSASINPLLRYSLAGQGNALEKEAQQQVPLLGSITLKGQISVWYAPPNTGKTLLALALAVRAVSDNRIAGDQVFYINADDSAAGLAQKVKLLDDMGIQTLTPGYNGFELSALAPALADMATNSTAKGTLIIIDTVKKFTDLMSKKEAAEFGKKARQFSLHGGSILALAHTNKNRAASGKLIHAGTSDLVEDFDSVHMLEAIDGAAGKAERLIKVQALKRRGNNAELTYFSFCAEDGLSYEARLLSVTETNPEYGDLEDLQDSQEEDLIATIRAAITNGNTKKMQLASIVGKAARTSRQKTLAIIEKYSGPNPEIHLWDFEVREHGAHLYFLHQVPEESMD